MKRVFDLIFALIIGSFLLPIALITALAIKFSSGGPVLFWSCRVGKNGDLFQMPKFRTMAMGAPLVGTSELENPGKWVTPLGAHLRRYSIDEIPQLWSIIVGKMSFVGPRPALPLEGELVSLREEKGINQLTPGLSGLAQISGRDDLTTLKKIELDAVYLESKSLFLDLKILLLTVIRVIQRKGISH